MIRYFLLANLYGFLFYGFYLLLLKGQTSHRWSRFYLLCAILLCLLLPWIRPGFSVFQSTGIIKPLQEILLPEIVLNGTRTDQQATGMNMLPLFIAYISILYFLLARFLYRIISLRIFLSKQQFITTDGYRLALNTGVGPASFGKAIVFPDTVVTPAILNHEKAHMHFRHHYDKLLLQLLRCFFFPVVPLHFMQQELSLVHEFEADAAAADDKETYSDTLLRGYFDSSQPYLLQSFFHHPLKRRIMMLHQEKKPDRKRHGLLLGLTAVIIAAALSFQSGGSATAQQRSKNKSQKVKADDSKVYVSVEELPQFPGGQNALMQFLAQNIRYPLKAKNEGIQGKVYLQFVIDKEGSVTNVVVQRDIGGGCGDEARRVVQAMPKWKPGKQDGTPVRVYYTLPVNFRLQK